MRIMRHSQDLPASVEAALTRGDCSVKVFRIACGMSTTAFAALCGMSVDRIEAIEAGVVPGDEEVLHMGRVLGLPADLVSGRKRSLE
jgi:DNA-binding transcriptional regulator YiaG